MFYLYEVHPNLFWNTKFEIAIGLIQWANILGSLTLRRRCAPWFIVFWNWMKKLYNNNEVVGTGPKHGAQNRAHGLIVMTDMSRYVYYPENSSEACKIWIWRQIKFNSNFNILVRVFVKLKLDFIQMVKAHIRYTIVH